MIDPKIITVSIYRTDYKKLRAIAIANDLRDLKNHPSIRETVNFVLRECIPMTPGQQHDADEFRITRWQLQQIAKYADLERIVWAVLNKPVEFHPAPSAPTTRCCESCKNIPCKPLNRIPCGHHSENPCIENGCTDIENCDEICEHRRIFSPAWLKQHVATIRNHALDAIVEFTKGNSETIEADDGSLEDAVFLGELLAKIQSLRSTEAQQ